MENLKITKIKIDSFHVILIISVMSAIFYGLNVKNELGADFGIYFSAGYSINENYGLYRSFFDHKGPLYYLFIKFLSFFVPYTLNGASMILAATCGFWITTIFLLSKLITNNRKIQGIGILLSISALSSQDSNSSIALFMASFTSIAIITAFKYATTRNAKWLVMSASCASCAALVRIDGLFTFFFIIVLVALTNPNDSKWDILKYFFISFYIGFLILIINAKILNFSIQEYLIQAIQFNFFNYNQASYEEFGIKVPIYSFGILLKSGIIFVAIFSCFNLTKQIFRAPEMILIVFGFLHLLVLNTDKNYHLFVTYPYIVAFILLRLTKDSTPERMLKLMGICLMCSAIWTTSLFALASKCNLLENVSCNNEYRTLQGKLDGNLIVNSNFYLNDGWIFVLLNKKANEQFTSFYPMMFDIDGATENLIKEFHTQSSKYIWFNKADLERAIKENEKVILSMLSGRDKAFSVNDTWIVYTPVKKKVT